MSIKRILVPLPDSISQDHEVEIAVSTAKTLNAHVEALFIKEPPPIRAAGVEAGSRAAIAGADLMRAHQQEVDRREQRAQEARENFVLSCKTNGIRFVEGSSDIGDPPTASWQETEGSYGPIVVDRAPAFDLVIASSASVAEPLKEIAESALLQTGRPVLLAPARMQKSLAGKIMIAWDESPECWHAVSAALPFMERAEKVQVVSIDKKNGNPRASQERVLAYLRCHGIKASAKVASPATRSIGEGILAAAGEEDAGLVVMGAYSHSRLREMLLGGATRHVLNTAAATPVLMAH